MTDAPKIPDENQIRQIIEHNQEMLRAIQRANRANSIKHYGDRILAEHSIKTDKLSGEVYFYDDKLGYYDYEFAMVKLKNAITDILDDKFSDNRMKQIINYIKIKTGIDLRNNDHVNCICLNNGIFDINTMKKMDHDPKKFVSFRIDTEYNPDIDMKPWTDYVGSVFHKMDLDKIQEAIGNILAPHYTTKKVIYLVGKKNSGKSTFIVITQDLLGRKNYSVLSLQDINKGQYTIAELYKKRANLCSEINYKVGFKNIALLKKLSGGDEFIARRIYGHPFSFTNNAKIFLSGNGIPNISDVNSDDAFWNRWEFITCPNPFEPDASIVDTYTTPKMKSRAFNWMIQGYSRLRKNNWKFTNAMTSEEVYDTFKYSNITRNTFLDWFSTCCVKDEGWELLSTLFRHCRDWHIKQGLTNYPVNLIQFGRAINGKFAQDMIPTNDYRPTINGEQKKALRGVKIC